MEEERAFQWKSIIWSAILIFAIPFIIRMLIPTVNATYVGFQTRGDSEAINLAVMAIVLSPLFWAFMAIVHAAVAFWRGWVLSRKVDYRPDLHALIAAGVGILVPVILDVMGNMLVYVLVVVVVSLAGAYLGAYLGRKQVRAE